MMSPLALSLVLASCGCWTFEPLAPYTSRAASTGWGEPVNGLSLLATTDADTVGVGDTLRFEAFFRFWPFPSDGRVAALVREHREERWTLVLRSRDGTANYKRPAFRIGMPVLATPDDHLDLRSGLLSSASRRFHLLSYEGEQIPAGDYEAVLTYRSPGAEKRRYWTGSCEERSEPYPPGSVWIGEVATGPLPLHVRPQEPDTTRYELPTGISLHEGEDGQLMWSWDPDSFEPVELVTRPGYVIGCRTKVRRVLETDDSRFTGLTTENLGGSLPDRRHLAGFALGAASAPGPGKTLGVEVRVTIFETSRPWTHAWDPEAGDYHVLREYTIERSWFGSGSGS
jgi:hypothetical protein